MCGSKEPPRQQPPGLRHRLFFLPWPLAVAVAAWCSARRGVRLRPSVHRASFERVPSTPCAGAIGINQDECAGGLTSRARQR